MEAMSVPSQRPGNSPFHAATTTWNCAISTVERCSTSGCKRSAAETPKYKPIRLGNGCGAPAPRCDNNPACPKPSRSPISIALPAPRPWPTRWSAAIATPSSAASAARSWNVSTIWGSAETDSPNRRALRPGARQRDDLRAVAGVIVDHYGAIIRACDRRTEGHPESARETRSETRRTIVVDDIIVLRRRNRTDRQRQVTRVLQRHCLCGTGSPVRLVAERQSGRRKIDGRRCAVAGQRKGVGAVRRVVCHGDGGRLVDRRSWRKGHRNGTRAVYRDGFGAEGTIVGLCEIGAYGVAGGDISDGQRRGARIRQGRVLRGTRGVDRHVREVQGGWRESDLGSRAGFARAR